MLRTNKNSIVSVPLNHFVNYPTPINLSYLWGYGSLASICLVIQIISGVFLAMHYVPTADLAFFSVEHIMRDVPNGWFIRYTHASGTSFFFLFTYIHIARGLYYKSFVYPRHFTWMSGLAVFILMMAAAFLGYVLPWGQMSFWAATVITNLFSAIPVLGNPIVSWLWGFYAVDSPTLHRFYSLHFLLPFLIVAAVLLHLSLLHKNGSNNFLHKTKPFYAMLVVKSSIKKTNFVFGLKYVNPLTLNYTVNKTATGTLVYHFYKNYNDLIWLSNEEYFKPKFNISIENIKMAEKVINHSETLLKYINADPDANMDDFFLTSVKKYEALSSELLVDMKQEIQNAAEVLLQTEHFNEMSVLGKTLNAKIDNLLEQTKDLNDKGLVESEAIKLLQTQLNEVIENQGLSFPEKVAMFCGISGFSGLMLNAHITEYVLKDNDLILGDEIPLMVEKIASFLT
jgi:hypothetical protein